MRQLISHFILDKYSLGQANGSLKAAGVFVDLSGFSKMTDELARHGQHGAETLAGVMRSVFGPMVDAVYARGGFVVGYAGDAFTAIFPEEQSQGPSVKRALSAVCAIQDHIRLHSKAVTPYGAFQISIKAGLGMGETTWQIFRSMDTQRAAYCVRGETVSSSVEAEERARSGRTVLDAAAYETLRTEIDARPLGDGFFELVSFPNDLLVTSQPAQPEPEPDPDLVRAFCPETIINLPIAGEFRQVVNLFVDLPAGITDEMMVAPFMETVFELQEMYDGYLLRPDVGDKGFNLLMFWGAPSAHETDIDRALNFVMELSARTGIPLRAGVSYRTAFAGFIGASCREDYTAYGWGVNLAARLMESALLDEIRLDEETASRAGKHFEVEFRDWQSFKGFADRQKVFLLKGRKTAEETIYRGELVGRADELARFVEFVAPMKEDRFAGALVIQGEAGIGKSRTVYEFQHSAAGDSFQWVVGQTDEILRQSLNPFKAWLRARFHFSEDQVDEVNWRNFDEQLQSLIDATSDVDLAAELTRTRTVLAAQLSLTQPGSFYDQLDAKGRYENTFIALSTLLHAECLRKPLVLFIEDLHWLDEDTRAFLPYLIRNTLANPGKQYPLAILATTRPEGSFPAVDQPGLIHELKLMRLSAAGLSRLAEGILANPVSPALADLLERRSEGNPFFAEQILRYLSENDLLLRLENGAYSAAPRSENLIPTDVNSVLIARLDKLTREVREVVQTASVLGREFEIRLLAEMLRDDLHFTDEIKSAERSDIWFALNELAYMFRHALLQDAAYSMQMQARRRELHTLAVNALEKLYSRELASHYGELAYHAEKARLDEKALRYLTLAGAAASSAYQNAEALDYYRRALVLVPKNNTAMHFELLAGQIALFDRIGDRVAQLEAINTLGEVSRELGDDHLSARYWKLRAEYYFAISDFSNTLDSISRVVELAEAIDNIELLLLSKNIWFGVLFRQGKTADAMQLASDNLELARQSGSLLDQGKILTSIGQVSLEAENPDTAWPYLDEAVAIARRIRDRSLEAQALNNLANLAGIIQGDYIAARQYYEQTYEVGREQGNREIQSIAVANLGWVTGMLGDYSAARSYHVQSLAIARESGNLYTEIYTLINLAAVVSVQGDAQLALQYTVRALELSRRVGDRGGEAWALFYSGQAALVQKNTEQAQSAFRQSLNIRTELGLSSLVMESIAGLVQSALETEDYDTAFGYAEKILSHLASGGTFEGAEEPLRIYLACYLALEQRRDPRANKILQIAAEKLKTQTSRIHDETARLRYVENVPWRRAIWKACQSVID